MTTINENTLEQLAINVFEEIGYNYVFGPAIAPEGEAQERKDFSEVILFDRLRSKLIAINPDVPIEGIEEAIRKVKLFDVTSPILQNKACHKMLVDGVDVQYQTSEGTKSDKVKLIDYENIKANEFLVINQFTVIENKNNRRPDLVVFVNGLALGVLELKNPADSEKDIWHAFNQLQTYKSEIGSLFHYNAVLAISDGLNSRVGSLTSDRERFLFWRTVKNEKDIPTDKLSLEVLIRGLFAPERFLNFVRYFIAYDQKPKSDTVVKVIAGYHQFNATLSAIRETVRAVHGDRRIGTVWHSTGSGKSYTMAFYAGMAAVTSGLDNPTVIVLTDRNDLDDQLFGQFGRVVDLLRQTPVNIESRKDLLEKLKTASGGIYFTTIQKFAAEKEKLGDTKIRVKFPLLSDRSNIIVVADEAHRSQYEFVDGFAQSIREALPNASFIGFTGTPISQTDADTRAVFGNYISVYDIEKSIKDQATVPIYYEGRLIKLERNENVVIDEQFEELTESDEADEKQRAKSKWAALEALVGVDTRLKVVAQNFVEHFENRQAVLDGEAMIVCMSRKICADLYNEIIKLRPDWHNDDPRKGKIKVVITGSAEDKAPISNHVMSKATREDIADNFKDSKHELQIVIVRDMWLTGFDVPSMHTMYIDKPMHGHGLMQAIARVNRVFKDKPGGLVVDYLGIADALKKTMGTYTESGGAGKPTIDKAEAVAVMKEKLEQCQDIMHGFKYQQVIGDGAKALALFPLALEFILNQREGKKRFTDAVYNLSRAFTLATPHPDAMAVLEEVAFFQSLNQTLNKRDPNKIIKTEDKEFAIKQLISKSVVAAGVVDIFSAAGLKKPNISVLSDEFLAEIQGLPHKNLAVELLEKLIKGELKTRLTRNKVQERQFSEMLDSALTKYQNRAIETAKIIEELIKMARDIREAHERGEKLGLTSDEMAFYDALEVNDSAVKVLGDKILKQIAMELVKTIKDNLDVDWSYKETSRAKVRMAVKRLLKKYGYPPDKTEKAVELVLEQAQVVCEDGV